MGREQQSLGLILSSARKTKDLTLRAVESKTGISNAYLSLLENGRVAHPSPTYLFKLGEIYELPYHLLMELAGYPVPERTKTTVRKGQVWSRFGSISRDEERDLLEYLEFLRARRSRKAED